MFVMKM